MMDEKEDATEVEARQSLPALDDGNQVEMISKQSDEPNVQEDPARQIQMELAEQNLHLQVTIKNVRLLFFPVV